MDQAFEFCQLLAGEVPPPIIKENGKVIYDKTQFPEVLDYNPKTSVLFKSATEQA
jgi:hypothetical protein